MQLFSNHLIGTVQYITRFYPFSSVQIRHKNMPVKIYKMDMSPPARAAMIACEVFDVPRELIDVDLTKKEHLRPEYIQKNPLHTIPVLEDGDFILHDSHAILMYLADTYGKTDDFYPKDLKRRALVNQKLFFDTAVLLPRIQRVSIPAMFYNMKKPAEKLLRDIVEAYGFTEEFLCRNKYIAADHITIADVSVITNITSLIHIVPLDAKKYPKTHAWMKYMESLPYVKKFNIPESAKDLLGPLDFSEIPEKSRLEIGLDK